MGWERATRGGRETHAEWGAAGLLAGRLETNFKRRAFLGIVVELDMRQCQCVAVPFFFDESCP